MFIRSAFSISHQPIFLKKDFVAELLPLPKGSELIQPDYKKYVPVALLRRMSKILRMSIACSAECFDQSKLQADAIIVGTGLGCLDDTEKFLNNLITIQGALLPPTSFIQSTHNTIAGQISLIFQNHGYNMTHTQNTCSFEHALIDAMLCLKDGMSNVLVGAADEYIPALDPIAEKLNQKELNLSSAASFFLLSQEEENGVGVKLLDSKSIFANASIEKEVEIFLEKNKIRRSDIGLMLYSSNSSDQAEIMKSQFKEAKRIAYTDYSGYYFSNSAFAFHMAYDALMNSKRHSLKKANHGNSLALICNQLSPYSLGLTLLESLEA